jgi:multicomponent Na+:H+ antiporter subunit E
MPNVRARSPLLEGRSAALATRLGLLSVLWVSLVDAHPVGLALGLLALPVAAWGSLALESPGRGRIHPLELLRFLPLCVGWALEGGLDVARRVLHPRMALSPGSLETRSRLPPGPARSFVNSVVGLVPGMLAVEAEGNTLSLHLLDASPEARSAALARLRDLEARVARIFGLPPPPRGLP